MPLATHEDVLQYGQGPTGYMVGDLAMLAAVAAGSVGEAPEPYTRPAWRNVRLHGQRQAAAAHQRWLDTPAQVLITAALVPYPSEGGLHATTPALALSASGTVLVQGALAVTLPAITATVGGLGPATAAGTATATMGAVTMAAAGTVTTPSGDGSTGLLTRTLRPSGTL